MAGARPLIRQNGITQEVPLNVALDGTCNDILLLSRQAGGSLLTVSSDTLIDGSVYLWEKDILPSGRKVYFEVVASGFNLGAAVGFTIGLYTAAGVLVAGSQVTVTSLTAKRVRSAAALTLADNTEYVIKYQTGGLVGSFYVHSARLIIR